MAPWSLSKYSDLSQLLPFLKQLVNSSWPSSASLHFLKSRSRSEIPLPFNYDFDVGKSQEVAINALEPKNNAFIRWLRLYNPCVLASSLPGGAM